MRRRGFEIVKGYEKQDIHLPKRSTLYSAGYDIEAATDIVVPKFQLGSKPVLVPTGVKAYMGEDEVLYLFNRSSNPLKKGLVLANSVGVIDRDYYENLDNDGHIFFSFYNYNEEDIIIHKHDKIGQGIFSRYLITDDDTVNKKRNGGFGSTDR